MTRDPASAGLEHSSGPALDLLADEKFRRLFEAAPDAMIIVNQEGNIVMANSQAEKLLGYTEQELLGESVEILVPERFRPLHVHQCAGYIENPKVRPMGAGLELSTRRQDGSEFPTEISLSPLTIDGRVFVVCALRDITGRRQVEEELRSSREQLRHHYTHLQAVREEERTRIAREIHDELGQALTALKMDLSWLHNGLPENPKTLREKNKAMLKLIDVTMKTVQRISAELRPGLLDDLGLSAAIEWQAKEFRDRTGIETEVIFSPEDIVIDHERSTVIFRIFQETLTNIARHAGATRLKISLTKGENDLALKVRDNGKGITKEQIFDAKSFGLIGMRERVHPFGGKVKIKGVPGRGTIVFVSMPLA